MSILIRGMEMPKNCHSCPMCLMRFCQAADRELSERETRPNAKRPEDCPLVPVPPHGRLIEADALRAKQQEDADLFQGSTAYGDKCRRDEAMNAVANIVNAPTIIPASFENPTKNARYSQDNPAGEGET